MQDAKYMRPLHTHFGMAEDEDGRGDREGVSLEVVEETDVFTPGERRLDGLAGTLVEARERERVTTTNIITNAVPNIHFPTHEIYSRGIQAGFPSL